MCSSLEISKACEKVHARFLPFSKLQQMLDTNNEQPCASKTLLLSVVLTCIKITLTNKQSSEKLCCFTCLKTTIIKNEKGHCRLFHYLIDLLKLVPPI